MYCSRTRCMLTIASLRRALNPGTRRPVCGFLTTIGRETHTNPVSNEFRFASGLSLEPDLLLVDPLDSAQVAPTAPLCARGTQRMQRVQGVHQCGRACDTQHRHSHAATHCLPVGHSAAHGRLPRGTRGQRGGGEGASVTTPLESLPRLATRNRGLTARLRTATPNRRAGRRAPRGVARLE